MGNGPSYSVKSANPSHFFHFLHRSLLLSSGSLSFLILSDSITRRRNSSWGRCKLRLCLRIFSLMRFFFLFVILIFFISWVFLSRLHADKQK